MNYKALIIGVLIGGTSIIGASIAIGISVRDVEVEENAYEAGLKYDQTLKRKAELGWQVNVPANLKSGTVALPVDVLDGSGTVLQNAVVSVELSRTGGHQAKTYSCSNTTDGRYVAEVNLDAPGYWDAWVRVDRLKDSLRFNRRIFVQ